MCINRSVYNVIWEEGVTLYYFVVLVSDIYVCRSIMIF